MIFYHYLKNFTRPFLSLYAVVIFGTSGYMLIEDWNLLDSLYMTTITISTVGYGETRPLSSAGKIFTMTLVGSGVVMYGLILNSIFNVFMEQRFTVVMNRVKMQKKIEKLKNHVLICGGGRMAAAVAKEFIRAKIPFVVIEKDREIAQTLLETRPDWPLLERDALQESVLTEARIEHARGLVSVLSTDADNLFVVLSARKMNPDLDIQTRISSESTRPKMFHAGADAVVSPQRVGGLQMARSFINPDMDNFLSIALDHSGFEFEFKTHPIEDGDENEGRTIMESNFRNKGYIIIGIRYPEGEVHYVPDARLELTQGMEVLLIGSGNQRED